MNGKSNCIKTTTTTTTKLKIVQIDKNIEKLMGVQVAKPGIMYGRSYRFVVGYCHDNIYFIFAVVVFIRFYSPLFYST